MRPPEERHSRPAGIGPVRCARRGRYWQSSRPGRISAVASSGLRQPCRCSVITYTRRFSSAGKAAARLWLRSRRDHVGWHARPLWWSV